eukprot:750168-Hanusia_phi.AAC.1
MNILTGNANDKHAKHAKNNLVHMIVHGPTCTRRCSPFASSHPDTSKNKDQRVSGRETRYTSVTAHFAAHSTSPRS